MKSLNRCWIHVYRREEIQHYEKSLKVALKHHRLKNSKAQQKLIQFIQKTTEGAQQLNNVLTYLKIDKFKATFRYNS